MSIVDDDIVSNPSNNESFDEVIEARLSRRDFLGGTLAVSASAALGGVGSLVSAVPASARNVGAGPLLGFEAIPISELDELVLPDGYTAKVLIRWDDPVSDGPEFLTDASNSGGDRAVRGDFDGDARQDAAIFRSTNSTWFVRSSATGTLSATPFGLPGDTRVSGDFDGDAKTDLAVYRDGVWYVLGSSDGQIRYINWGLAGDVPVSGDYDGDGKTDAAIWRNGIFYIQNSGGPVTYFPWGTTGDSPIASVFNN